MESKERMKARARLEALVARDRVLVIDTPAKEADLKLAYGSAPAEGAQERRQNDATFFGQ